MPRALAHYLPREMAVLGLIEGTLSFAAIYVMLQAAGTPAALQVNLAFLISNNGGLYSIVPQTIALAALLSIGAVGIASAIGLYRLEACVDRGRLLTLTGLTAFLGLIVLFYTSGVTTAPPVSIAQMLLAWLVAMAMIRLGYSLAIARLALSRRIVILGALPAVEDVRARMASRRGGLFQMVPLLSRDLSWPLLRQHRIWGIVIASDAVDTDDDALLECKFRGMRVMSSAGFHENYLGRIDLAQMTASGFLLGRSFGASRVANGVKRIADVTIAIVMLVLALPLMALTAIAIKIDSPGPVLYRQQRIGQFDTPFMLFKFRSMTADAEACGKPRWAQKHDPRVTRLGRYMRATRIDELPQLVNVIRGEMSLVGPRPERPHFVEQLERAIPFYRQRCYVKPGLTGWAQVNFPYGASVEDAREKLSYDLYYVKNRSLLLDAAILLATVRVVLFREGAR